MSATITWAIRLPDESNVHVSAVSNGIECGCVCASCKKPVIAKHGGGPDEPNSRAPHFAHVAEESTCTNGGESGLHRAAKAIILDEMFIEVPDITDPSKTRMIVFDECFSEVGDHPYHYDVMGFSGSKACIIEIKKSHATTDKDRLRRMKRVADFGIAVSYTHLTLPTICSV